MATTRAVTVACAALVAVAAVGAIIVVRSSESASTTPTTVASARATNPFRTGHVLVIPHGGGDGLFPEDTMLAYDRTIAMGADMVDVDLRLSSDGVVIDFHDNTVDRMTGTSGNVGAMSFADLATLDAGYTFSPTETPANSAVSGAPSDPLHPFRGIGVRIPSFESVLQRFPNVPISIDLKDESTKMIAPVCSLLVRYHRVNDVFVGSNSDDQILQFRKDCPAVRTSATLADVIASRNAEAAGSTTFVPAVFVDQPPFRRNGQDLVDATSLTWAHEHGVAIMPWVVNDEADMKLLIGLGVDAIYTSYPDVLLRLLGRCTAACG